MNKASVHVGWCIYCGMTDELLTDEHAIPYGLGGTMKLRKASCRQCAEITSRFELDVQRNLWRNIRIAGSFPTRNQHPVTIPLTLLEEDGPRVVELDVTKSGAPVDFLHYLAPAYLSGEAYEKGISFDGHATFVLPSKDAYLEYLQLTYGTRKHEWRLTFKPTSLARMLAKIAYCCVVAQDIIDGGDGRPLTDNFVLPAILDLKDNIGRWVGCDRSRLFGPPIQEHWQVDLFTNPRNDAIAEIRLFGPIETPVYQVVVGRLKGDRWKQSKDPSTNKYLE